MTKKTESGQKHIGRGFTAPKPKTEDKHNPFAGGFGVRGAVLTGKVVSTKMALSATIEMQRQIKIPKYKRYITRTYKVKAHNPENINAQVGQTVQIAETRPISKTKHFCIVKIIESEQQ